MNEAAPTLAPNTMPGGGVSLHTRECSFALLTSDGQNLGLGAGILEVGLDGSKDAGRHGAVGDDGGLENGVLRGACIIAALHHLAYLTQI